MDLTNRVALITGAGSGIGKAAALRLAGEGASVGVLSRTENEVAATVREIEEAGGTALPLIADVAEVQALDGAVQRLADTYGRLDVVVANAGINGVWAPLEELTPEEWDATLTPNLKGTFLTLRACVPHLRRAGGGSIVIVSSINGTRTFSNPGTAAYACSKAGQMALAEVAAVELAKHRIRVNVICPGRIDTEIGDNTYPRHLEAAGESVEFPDGEIPLTDGRPGTARDVADLILFLASERSRHITGTPVWIDGGQSLLR